MSGEKEVRISSREYARLKDAACQADIQARRGANLESRLNEARQKIQAQTAEAERCRQAFDQSVQHLSAELRDSARDFSCRLGEQRRIFDRGLANIGQRVDGLDEGLAAQRRAHNELAAGVEAGFAVMARQLDEGLAAQRRVHDELAANVEAGFAAIARKELDKRRLAEQWLRDCRIIIDHIDAQPRHRQFAPGETDRLRAALAIGEDNMASEMFEAAAASAQSLYGAALRVQADVEFQQMQWDAWFAQAQTSSGALLAEIEAQAGAEWMFEADEGAHKLAAEVDYWSEGALSGLKDRLLADLRRVEREADTVGLEELKALARENEARAEELRELTEKAKERLFASIMRINLAQDIADELEASGWKVQEGTWQGAETDQKGGRRNSYHLKLADLAGNEMVTIILPEEDGSGLTRNRLQFAYFPKDNNDARFAGEQTGVLNRKLQEMGAIDGQLTCVAGHERTRRGSEAKRDFAATRAFRAPAGEAARVSRPKAPEEAGKREQ
jgi:hypothetical protein